LYIGKQKQFLISSEQSAPFTARVNISHEPWGEATIDIQPNLRHEVSNPKVTIGTIRFITSDVAITDGAFTYLDGVAQITPLLFVIKRQADGWRIASVRLLSPL
jgi:hypothetical protein